MVHIIRLHGDPHGQTQSLLPWYINGTLDESEAAVVTAHLSECAECRADLKAEQALGREIANVPTDVERGWAALRRRLDGEPPRRTSRHWLAPRALLRRPVAIGWALLVQAAVVLLMVGPARFPAAPTPLLYRALGADPAASPGNVVVIFRPDTPEQALRAVLLRNGARLVDGPTVSHAYLLRVAAGQRNAALSRLRSDGHVVLAEPLDGEPQP